jgi:hypothetical protein
MSTYQERLRAQWPAHRSAVLAGVMGSLTLGLAPFYPHAHIYKQIMNILHGTLTEWIDVVDLLMHGAPWVVLLVAVIRFLTSAQAPLSTPGKHP